MSCVKFSRRRDVKSRAMKSVLFGAFCLSLLVIPIAHSCFAAEDDDFGYYACNKELERSGRVSMEKWLSPPIEPHYEAAAKHFTEGASVIRWFKHVNPNSSTTAVIEIREPTDDLGTWIVLYDDGSAVAFKAYVGAVGFGFSKGSSKGVNGLFFCGKQGMSKEWVWDGARWQ